MNDWVTNKLGNIASVQTGPFGSQLHQKDYVSVGTPIITVEHLGENRILHFNLPKVNDEDKVRLKKYWLKEGDIVFSRVGSVDRRAYVNKEEDGWLFSGRCLRVRPSNIVNGKFLSYFFGMEEFKARIRAVAVGATMPSLNTSLMQDIDVSMPKSLATQKAIAHILGTLDDKIELLRQMNETLEAIARAIFKSWFVDFDPVRKKADGLPTGLPKEIEDLFPSEFEDSELGEIPKGWKVGKLGELTNIVGGSTPSTTNESFWNGEYHFATPKDLSNATTPILLSTERRITLAGIKEISSGVLEKGTLLMSSRAPIGYISLSEIPVSINQGFIGFKKEAYISNFYLFFWLKQNMETIIGNANGTTFLEISKANFRQISAIQPPKELLTLFDNNVSNHFLQLKEYTLQINNLISIRDSLLPKLISGEHELSDDAISKILERAK